MPYVAFSSCSAKPQTCFVKKLPWRSLSTSVSKGIASCGFPLAVSNPLAKSDLPLEFVKNYLKEFYEQDQLLLELSTTRT